MRTGQSWIMLLGVAMLGGCGSRDEASSDNGTALVVRSEDGKPVIRADGDGKVALDLPGIKGEIKLPKVALDSGNFDLDGVKLYPGSQVKGVDVRDRAGSGEGALTVTFQSPAKPETVRDYLLSAFRDKGVSATAQGNRVQGKDKAGEPFTIELAADGGATRGILRKGR